MTNLTITLLEWVFTATFLILVVLGLRAALGKRMGAGLRYALWAVVLVRLLVPVQLFPSPLAGTRVFSETHTEKSVYTAPNPPAVPENPDGVLSLGGQTGPLVPLTTGPNVPSVPNAPNLPDAPEPPKAPDLTKVPEWLGWTWLAGSLAVAAVLVLSNLRFYGKLRRERIPLDEADLPVRVYVAVDLPSPCLFGLFRPAIYVTPEAAADQRMFLHVLAHEYTHYCHGDHIWSFLRCAALAVHWWNPLVWLAARLSQRDAELACDEGALKRLGDGERAGYGSTLLALVTAKPRPGDLFRCATTMAGDKKSLKERISRIACAPKRILWVIVVAVTVTALACLCAFGQAEPGDEDEPEPDPMPKPSSIQVVPAYNKTGTIPEQVQTDAEEFVRINFESLRDKGIAFGLDGAAVVPDPPELDQWRIDSLKGPCWCGEQYWNLLGVGRYVELWNVVYSYHTTTPEKATHLGNAEVTEDGWISPINYGAEYLVYELDENGNRTLLTTFGEVGGFVGSVSFRRNLRIELSRGGVPEDMQDRYFVEEHAEFLPSDLGREVDLNRNGIPETVQVVNHENGMYYTLEIWEGNRLLWVDEAHSAHAGYNAVFLCTLDGNDYLLRYNPYMGQGWGSYSYKLFTLSENGEEQQVQGRELEFDINFHPLQHQSFDPEVIASFVDEVNGLLAHSVQLVNTDDDLLSSFEREGRLYDSLTWLDWWEPTFVRDGRRSLLNNLRVFQTVMESEWYAEDPVVLPMNEDMWNAHVLLRYQDRNTQFDADWDWGFQPAEHVEPKILDLNGDGRDEIVIVLIGGHGTGALVESLFVFDAETLEQYDTSGLNRELLNSVRSTGDEDNFYLSGPGMEVTIPKSEAQAYNEYADMADYIDFGMENYIFYTIEDGKVFCWVGCDASGLLVNYIGYVRFSLGFDPGRVSAGVEAPGYTPQNHFYYTAQYVEAGPDALLF